MANARVSQFSIVAQRNERKSSVEGKPLPSNWSDVSDSRRRNMAAIRGKNTSPENHVRKLLFRLGYRFRIHASWLPGTPDIVFTRRKKVIEVRGCFWHRHKGCPKAATPITRSDFWARKFAATVERDNLNLTALEAAGWKVLVIWECELHRDQIGVVLRGFLGPPRSESPNDMV